MSGPGSSRFLLILYVVLLTLEPHLVYGSLERFKKRLSAEKEVTHAVLRGYRNIGRNGRPITNSSGPMGVSFGLGLVQMDLDEKNKILITSVWCRYKWRDEYMGWDPKDYEDVQSIRLPSKRIWIPDILLYNTADTEKLEREAMVVISYDGTIMWIPHRIYKSSCSIDVTNFPFDSQRCRLIFGSWSHDGFQIEPKFYKDRLAMDLSIMQQQSSEWDITENSAYKETKFYACCREPYITLNFEVELTRKIGFSSYLLTLPCVFLACTTLVVFWLPPDRPDRTGLAMSVFGSFMVLLLILVEAAPPTARSVPTLGLYYCFNMVLIMLSIFLSTFVINISRRWETQNRVPHWLYVLAVDVFARVLFRRGRHLLKTRNPLRQQQSGGRTIANENGRSAAPSSVYLVNDNSVIRARLLRDSESDQSVAVSLQRIERSIDRLDSTLHKICLHQSDRKGERDSYNQDNVIEWRIVANVLDRIFFLIYILAIVVSLITLFPRPIT